MKNSVPNKVGFTTHRKTEETWGAQTGAGDQFKEKTFEKNWEACWLDLLAYHATGTARCEWKRAFPGLSVSPPTIQGPASAFNRRIE